MKKTITIFKKELIDSIRDRRTLITMVIVPLLLFPLILTISSKVAMSQRKKQQEEVVKAAVIANNNAENLRLAFLHKDDFEVSENISIEQGTSLIKNDSLDAMIIIDAEFDKNVAEMKPGKIDLYFKSAERRDIKKDRVMALIEDFMAALRSERFKKLNINEELIEPVRINEENLASSKEKLASVIGGFLPYIFILFCFMGSMYPAIDLAAGEKERGTLETLLTSPAGRMQILIGKFGVVVLTGIISAGVSFVGLFLAVRQVPEIPTQLMQTIVGILEFQSIAVLLSLLIPLTFFFAAVLLAMSIYAKSFKEAQSIITPMTIVVIIPAFMGMLPGMELNFTTAMIPILNVTLATKEIIAGTMSMLLLAEVYLSLIFFSAAALFICAKMFRRESAVFR